MRANPVSILTLAVFGLIAVSGSAGAGFLTAGVDSCAKPLTVPVRFNDTNGDGSWSPGDFYDPLLTGYRTPADVGLQLSFHAGVPPGIAPGQYFMVNYPPVDQGTPLVGETWFREWMSGCSPYPVTVEDSLQLEPGNMVTAFAAEVDSLFAADSTAVWDVGSNTVVGSQYEVTPRILAFPLYDPSIGVTSGRNEVVVRKIVFFFIESRGPGTLITGRVVDVVADDGTPVRPATWGRLKNLYRRGGSP